VGRKKREDRDCPAVTLSCLNRETCTAPDSLTRRSVVAVRTLEDYLRITPAQAEGQWRAVLSRRPPENGARQGDFLPVETLATYSLFFVLNPHRLGGRTKHLPTEITDLAAALRRTTGSILLKLYNLDGLRRNGAVVEPVLYAMLQGDRGLFFDIYMRILRGARQAGIAPAILPDVLGIEHGGTFDLLGQEEIEGVPVSTVERAIEADLPRAMTAWGLDERETQKVLLATVRIGQNSFAREVHRAWQGACAFCGLAPRSLLREGLLVASHLKPWAVSEKGERLTPTNGVLACPTHDRALDRGLLSLERDLSVVRSPRLVASIASDPGVAEHFGAARIRERLEAPPVNAPERRFLDYHRNSVFRAA
jgi:putative restriction endonuclease